MVNKYVSKENFSLEESWWEWSALLLDDEQHQIHKDKPGLPCLS